jgi:hypothetical protein
MNMRRVSAPALVAYHVLGASLVATRFVGLDHGFWHDEIVAVREYVRTSPYEILFGPGVSHQLFSILGWATSSLFGESETALRLISVIPFVAGVVLVTAWLHVRVGALSGVLFLFLATVSPLLLDITRQARGYGLGFLAMALVIVGTMEAQRDPRIRYVVMLCAGGLVGTLTLPNFAIAFVATSLALLSVPALRRPVAVGVGASLVVVALWYAPHRDALDEVSRTPYGNKVGLLEALTAPFDQILLPGLMRFDGETPNQSLAWLPIVAVIAVPVAMSPFLRSVRTAWILGAGIVASVLALVVSGAFVVPRYASFLLVPAFVLLATGCASVLGNLRHRPQLLRTVITGAVLALLVVAFLPNALRVTGLPREAHRDVAELVTAESSTAPVFARVPQPGDLRFYLDRPVEAIRSHTGIAAVCEQTVATVFVSQPWRVSTREPPCKDRRGVRRVRLEQYARGGHIDVWFIPPGS